MRNDRGMRRLAGVALILVGCGKSSGPAPSPTATGPAPLLDAPAADPLATAALPTITGNRLQRLDPGSLIVVSKTGLVIDGRAVASLTNGRVADAVLDESKHRIGPVVTWAKERPPNVLVRVAIDPALPAVLLMQVIDSFPRDQQSTLSLVVHSDDGVSAVPLEPGPGPRLTVGLDDKHTVGALVAELVRLRRDGRDAPELAWLTDEDLQRYADSLLGVSDDDRGSGVGDLSSVQVGRARGAPAAGLVASVAVSGGKSLDDTSLTFEAVTAKVVTSYLAALKRCYKQALAIDPSLTTVATVHLSVNEVGRGEVSSVEAPTAELRDCIAGAATYWRFAIPRDASDEPITASFDLALKLSPAGP